MVGRSGAARSECLVAGDRGLKSRLNRLHLCVHLLGPAFTTANDLEERARRVIDEHEAIVDAIGRGHAEAAGLAMRYHLHRVRQCLTDRQRDN